jgi:putative addiction module component (TIGR02574 family)
MQAWKDIRELALLLPRKERARLARQLLLSLEPDEMDDDYEAAWTAEIEARLARVEKGDYTASDRREAIARIRHGLPVSSPT